MLEWKSLCTVGSMSVSHIGRAQTLMYYARILISLLGAVFMQDLNHKRMNSGIFQTHKANEITIGYRSCCRVLLKLYVWVSRSGNEPLVVKNVWKEYQMSPRPPYVAYIHIQYSTQECASCPRSWVTAQSSKIDIVVGSLTQPISELSTNLWPQKPKFAHIA